MAERGRIRNKEKCRSLEDGIFEFKGGCLRIAWFWDEENLIICTHGFVKKRQKTPPGEIDRARRIRDLYRSAKAEGRVREI